MVGFAKYGSCRGGVGRYTKRYLSAMSAACYKCTEHAARGPVDLWCVDAHVHRRLASGASEQCAL